MAQLQVNAKEFNDLTFVKLARELAMGITPFETILSNNHIDLDVWETIQKHPRFLQLLETELSDWGSALNTHERVKLKSAAMMEEWLPEAYSRMTDPNENLNSKTELAKLVTKLAGMGLTNASIEGGGAEKISININLGADKISFQKDITLPVIEADAE